MVVVIWPTSDIVLVNNSAVIVVFPIIIIIANIKTSFDIFMPWMVLQTGTFIPIIGNKVVTICVYILTLLMI